MKKEYSQIIISFLICFISCTIIGLIFRGSSVFSPQNSSFQFIWFGFMGSIYISIRNINDSKKTWILYPVLIVFDLIAMGKGITLNIVLRDVIFIGVLVFSIELYLKVISSFPKIPKFIRSLILANIYGVLALVATHVMVYVVNASSFQYKQALFINAFNSLLIGLAIGFGFDLYVFSKKLIFNKISIESE